MKVLEVLKRGGRRAGGRRPTTRIVGHSELALRRDRGRLEAWNRRGAAHKRAGHYSVLADVT